MVEKYEISEYGIENRDDELFINHKLIDTNKDFYFSSLLVNGKDIFSYKKDFIDIVNFIIDSFESKVNKFIAVIDYSEAFLSSSEGTWRNSVPNLELLIKCFEKRKMIDRLVWRSSGLNPSFRTPIKHEPITSYLGTNMEYMFDVNPRKFTHNFLSLYRGYKPIREEFHVFLEQTNIIKKTLFSYNSEFNKTSPWTFDYKISLDDESITPETLMKPGEYFRQTFCSIVYEALWDIHQVFFTEKINKCILTGHPFIVISSPKYISFMKRVGFKTFDKWWDESYDIEIDDNKRKEKIKNIILEISSWSLEKCESIYKEMIPVLKYNQEILKDISKNRISDTYTLIKYKSELI